MELIPNKLYFSLASVWRVKKQNFPGHVVSYDELMKHGSVRQHFGPPTLRQLWKQIADLDDRLRQASGSGGLTLLTNSKSDDLSIETRTLTSFMVCAYAVLRLGWNPDTLNQMMLEAVPARLAFFRDYHGDSAYRLTILDCLKALELGCRRHGWLASAKLTSYPLATNGTLDMNWIIPGKFLALKDPAVSRDSDSPELSEVHMRELKRLNVGIVIRLNGQDHVSNFDYYGGSYLPETMEQEGIQLYDIPFKDVGIPTESQVETFLRISEDAAGPIGVHCHAGLGRTATMIGCYLIKNHGFNGRAACAWMKMCRKGSVMGPQHFFMDKYEKIARQQKSTQHIVIPTTQDPHLVNSRVFTLAPETPSQFLSAINGGETPVKAFQKQTADANGVLMGPSHKKNAAATAAENKQAAAAENLKGPSYKHASTAGQRPTRVPVKPAAAKKNNIIHTGPNKVGAPLFANSRASPGLQINSVKGQGMNRAQQRKAILKPSSNNNPMSKYNPAQPKTAKATAASAAQQKQQRPQSARGKRKVAEASAAGKVVNLRQTRTSQNATAASATLTRQRATTPTRRATTPRRSATPNKRATTPRGGAKANNTNVKVASKSSGDLAAPAKCAKEGSSHTMITAQREVKSAGPSAAAARTRVLNIALDATKDSLGNMVVVNQKAPRSHRQAPHSMHPMNRRSKAGGAAVGGFFNDSVAVKPSVVHWEATAADNSKADGKQVEVKKEVATVAARTVDSERRIQLSKETGSSVNAMADKCSNATCAIKKQVHRRGQCMVWKHSALHPGDRKGRLLEEEQLLQRRMSSRIYSQNFHNVFNPTV